MKSIKYKIIINFCLIAIVSIVLIGIAVSWKLSETMSRQSAKLSADMTTRAYESLNLPHQTFNLLIREDMLRNANDLRKSPTLIANLESGQLKALAAELYTTAMAQSSDFVLLFNLEGQLEASFPGNLDEFKLKEYVTSWEFGAYMLNMVKDDAARTAGVWEALSRHDSQVLKVLGLSDCDISNKGALSSVAAGIVTNDFGESIGICFVGKLLSTCEKPLQQIHDITGYASVIYLETIPITQVGFEHPTEEELDLATLQISPEFQSVVYKTVENTNQVLMLAGQRYLCSCSALTSFTGNRIGMLCAGTPESQITDMQQAILSDSVRTKQQLQGWILGIGGMSLGVFVLVSLAIATRIVSPIRQLSTIARNLATGDFQQEIPVVSRDEMGELGDNFRQMQGKIKSVLSETDRLIQAVQAGKLDIRGNAEAFAGGWRNLIEGINTVIEAFVAPITMTADTLDRIAQGDIPDKITEEYQGDFNHVTQNLNRLIDTMNDLLRETKGLIQAVQDGKLNTRSNAETFVGDWRELVVGINGVIEAFVTPISMTAEYVDRISKGDIPDNITDEYRGDFNEIKHNVNMLIEAMHAITHLAEAMADGNLSVDIKERSAQDILVQALQTMVQRLNSVVSDVKSASEMTTSGSQAMSAGAEEMSQGATEQAATAEEVSSSMEEMVANIRQNAENALQTEKIARQSAADARDSDEAVAKAVTAMKAIAKQIKMVEEIASQTHMLSLNATIEAAKAEEHGKGFAVVAAEVRGLAERSRVAAEKISELAGSGVAVAEQAGEKLDRLVPNIQRTAELVQEISAASGEQHSGAEQINRAMQQLDQIIQQNASNSEEMASTAEELASQAEQLQSTMAFFRVDATIQRTLTSDAEPRVRVAENSDHGMVGVDKAPADNARSMIDMGDKGHGGDELDAEFEKY